MATASRYGIAASRVLRTADNGEYERGDDECQTEN